MLFSCSVKLRPIRLTKEQHIAFILSSGKFKIKCSHAIFSIEEIKCIEKYGYWFSALIEGKLTPITREQELFIKVFRENEKPITPEQVAWFKYVKRCELEAQHPEKFGLNYSANSDDPFFGRDDWKKMRKWVNR